MSLRGLPPWVSIASYEASVPASAGDSLEVGPGGLRRSLASGVISPTGMVDLSRVRFVTPGGMVGLACLLETWISDYDSPVLVAPEDDNVARVCLMNTPRGRGPLECGSRGARKKGVRPTFSSASLVFILSVSVYQALARSSIRRIEGVADPHGG